MIKNFLSKNISKCFQPASVSLLTFLPVPTSALVPAGDQAIVRDLVVVHVDEGNDENGGGGDDDVYVKDDDVYVKDDDLTWKKCC